ncbi:MAG: hypothetical protein ACT4OZ_16715 [Gemmatimonadota bacterium]
MAEPTTTATALQSPSRRGSDEVATEEGVVIGQCYSGAAPRTRRSHISAVPILPLLLLFIALAAVALYGQMCVLRSALAGRTPGAGTTRAARVRETVWILLPALALLLVLVATWRAVDRRTTRTPSDVVGRQPQVAATVPSQAR